MKPVFILSILLILGACTHHKNVVKRIKGFEYPLDSIGNGKRFVFQNKANNTFRFIDERIYDDRGVTYMLIENYYDNRLVMSDKYILTEDYAELVESTGFSYGRGDEPPVVQKMEIDEISNLEEKEYRGVFLRFESVFKKYYKGKLEYTETFRERKAITLDGKVLDVLVFDSRTKASGVLRGLPFFLGSEKVTTGQHFVAKDVGMVKYSNLIDSVRSEFELVNILSLDKEN